MIKLCFPLIISALLLFSSAGPGDDPRSVCLYSLKIPADLDVPTTPHFDTTIVRSKACIHHVLILPSQGTETSYTISPAESSVKLEPMIVHFFHGSKGQLDITNLPAGKYSVSLMACGNGGGFTLSIR